MAKKTIQVDSVAEAFLALLADRGVDYLFGNAGTDFTSIIEGLSKAVLSGTEAPTPVTVPHEGIGVAMAHGYYLVTGRPQAVMFHVNVGTANGLCGLMNASRENIPMIFASGRTPIHEEGVKGARTIFIHWGQEMFDQGGIVREMVKWDYELRNGRQLESVVDRALSVAMSEPTGPVYLSLPREVLAEEPGDFTYETPTRRMPARAPAADANAIDEAVAMLAAAERPVIITASFGRDTSAVAALGELAERFALPVASHRGRYVCLPNDHPMHLGYEAIPWVDDADVILSIDCDVPWIPALHKANPDAKVIHIGIDPLFAKYPVRNYPADLAITGSSTTAVPALLEAMSAQKNGAKILDSRRKRATAARQKLVDGWKAQLDQAATLTPIEPVWVAHCLDQVKGKDDIVVNESTMPQTHVSLTKPGTYFGTGPSGGLGWGLGAGLGVKLATPDHNVFSVVGDGGYMFGNPTPAHYVGASMDLPVLTMIINNAMWGSVRKATLGLYPDGAAAKLNRAPLTHLQPSPNFEGVVETVGGYGEKVEAPEDLPGALERAMKAVEVEKRQAVLNISTAYTDQTALAQARR